MNWNWEVGGVCFESDVFFKHNSIAFDEPRSDRRQRK